LYALDFVLLLKQIKKNEEVKDIYSFEQTPDSSALYYCLV
jgi:hypothetical protein